jgi:hypothetical protein
MGTGNGVETVTYGVASAFIGGTERNIIVIRYPN